MYFFINTISTYVYVYTCVHAYNQLYKFISQSVIFQVASVDMFNEKNTGTNLPAQIEIYATPGNEYHFLFIAKGGGSANKTQLYQQTKALLNPDKLTSFINPKIKVLQLQKFYFVFRYRRKHGSQVHEHRLVNGIRK